MPGGGAPNVAGGFHSRPNGLNPNTYAALGGTAVAVPAGAPAGIYTITNFQLTVGGNVAVKAISTMFPDNCSRAQVVASIRNAAPAPVGGLLPNGVHVGLSGATPAHCRDNAGNAFNVRVVVGGNQIITAYPAY